MERRRLYLVSNYDQDIEKVVKLTDEQAKAIDWVFRTFEDFNYYNIELAEDAEDIDEP